MRQAPIDLSEPLKTNAQLVANIRKLIDGGSELFIAEVYQGAADGADHFPVTYKPGNGLRSLVAASVARNGNRDAGFQIIAHGDKDNSSRVLCLAYNRLLIGTFIERLIGTIRRESLDHVLFWNKPALEGTLQAVTEYYRQYRIHASLDGTPPLQYGAN